MARLAYERRETKRVKRTRVVIQKPYDFGDYAPRQDNGQGALRDYQKAQSYLFLSPSVYEKSKNQKIGQILREKNSDVVEHEISPRELENGTENLLIQVGH